jgi:hypothetical protein
MEARETRRDRSWRYARRTQEAHLRAVHPDGRVDCPCEQSVWFFAKRKAVGCDCRKRRRGQPKVSRGPCYGPEVRDAVRTRIEGRRVCDRWRAWVAVHAPDDFVD